MRNVPLELCLVVLPGVLAAGCGTPTTKFMADRPKIEASVALLVTRELTDYPLMSVEDMAEDYVAPALEAAFAEVRTIAGREEPAIRAERDFLEQTSDILECTQTLSRARVPYSDCAIPACGCQHLTVGTEGGGEDDCAGIPDNRQRLQSTAPQHRCQQ